MENEEKKNNQENETDPRDRLNKMLESYDVADSQALTPPRQYHAKSSGNAEPKKEESPTPLTVNHHPTGDPESTAGWYADELGSIMKQEENSVNSEKDIRTNVSANNSSKDSQAEKSSNESSSRPFVPPFTTNQLDDLSATRPNVVRRRSDYPSQFSDAEGSTRASLPRPINQMDTQATRVTPAAYKNQTAPPTPAPRPNYTVPTLKKVKNKKRKKSGYESSGGNGNGQSAWGCFVRLIIGLLFVVVVLILAAGSLGVYQYFKIASTLPTVDNLRERAAKFETTRILDRNGNVIYEILDPNAGRRTYVPLEKISAYLIAATIATEDKEYYNHPGFDPVAVARAFVQNYTAGEIVSGASTITQQVARMLLLDDTERFTRSYERKAREIVLAAEITRKYSKEEILEIFLNENNYGNLAYGIEAASETYFNITADRLNLAQSSFLAGLPQAPAIYDIYTNRDATLNRQKQVLILMYTLSQEKNCIFVSTSLSDVCVDEIANAAAEMEKYSFEQRDYSMRFPHWVNYIRTQLESQFDPQTIYRSGFTVYTTLDPGLQDSAQQIVQNQIADLQDKNASSGAVVVIRPNSGEILAMVGSADFNNERISGQVNMALAPRQPGSAIKPLVYLAAFEKKWTPATLIWDIPTEFTPSGDPNDPGEKYRPVNYDGRFHGPQTVRSALANSYNIPAVKALQFVGIYDNPNTGEADGFINFARRMGISTLDREDYGLSLSLGGGDVTLLELTNAYATLANNGSQIPPVAITKIVDHLGNLVYEYQIPAGKQVVRPEFAYLITSIISDNQARSPMFGENSVLNLPFQVAAKTGTTNDFRDNWTMGYTPDVAVGVWVGNADYTQMIDTSGLTGAAPIWAEIMQMAENQITGSNPTSFSRPAGIIDRVICSISGSEPSEWCPSQRNEMFAPDRLPLPSEDDLWKKVNIDTWTGYRASAACNEFTKEEFVLNIEDDAAKKWISETGQGQDWARSVGFETPVTFLPERECRVEDPHPKIIFSTLFEGQMVTTNPIDIYGVVDVEENFDHFVLEYGRGSDPQNWERLAESDRTFRDVELLFSWDIFEEELEEGNITLRIKVYSRGEGRYAEKKIHININIPTPTATITPTPTLTATPTITPTPTLTPTVTPTFTNTPTQPPSTNTPPVPTATPIPTATPVPPTPT